MTLRIETPRAYAPLLNPARYKGAYGGRGSGKSHFFAELMVEENVCQKLDNVCLREVQRTLQHSVKKLLEQKIVKLDVGRYFEIQERQIYTRNGGIIIFEGMQNYNADSIKSLEGFDRAWFEEAQSASQRSLDLLRPTIRKDDSELWFSWNPDLASDPIDVLLRGQHPPPSAVVVQANYRDNPWLPQVLRDELEYDQKHYPDKFAHIWLGEYQRNSEARVFKNWTIEEFDRPAGTIYRLGADWGFSIDPSVLIRCSIDGKRLYVDHEAYMIGCEITQLPDLFDRVPDSRKWFISADSARPETISHMRNNGYPKMNAATKGPKSVEEGVAFLQSFEIVVHPRCQHLIDELTLYSYKTDPLTGVVLPILADKHNHCIAEGVAVTCLRGDVPIEQVTTDDMVLTRGGYRRVLFAGQTDADRETMLVGAGRGVVRCTPDHEIWTERGFVRADALSYDDEIITMEQSWSSAWFGMAASIAAILMASRRQTAVTFNAVLRAALHGYTAMCGSSITGLSRKVWMFITSIMTAGTTPLLTLFCSPASATRLNIHGKLIEWSDSASYWRKSDRSLNIGTRVQRDTLRMSGSVDWRMPDSSRARKSVSTARQRLPLARWVTLTCTVATPASQRPAALAGLTTWFGNVLRAALDSVRTATARLKLVRVRVEMLRVAEPCARVYDLTVEEHHEFFAGGILVSNCIDSLRYACEGARKAAKTQVVDMSIYRPSQVN